MQGEQRTHSKKRRGIAVQRWEHVFKSAPAKVGEKQRLDYSHPDRRGFSYEFPSYLLTQTSLHLPPFKLELLFLSPSF